MRNFEKLNELRIDLIKSLAIGLISPMSTIIFMGIIDKTYFSDKMGLGGLLIALLLLICGLKCISKVYAIAIAFDLLKEGDHCESV